MKRIRAGLLIAMCLVWLLPAYAAAEDAVGLVVGQAMGRRGEQVTLEVSLNGVNGAAAGSFNVCYDGSALTLVSAQAGEAMAGRACAVNERYAAGTVRVTFAGTLPIPEDSVLLRLTFQIGRYAALGGHAVTAERVKLSDADGGLLSEAFVPGGIAVQAVSMELGSIECAPGQDASLDVSLGGNLMPCGGEFEIRYDARLLTAVSVEAAAELGGVPVSLTYKADGGTLRVSWSAAQPIGSGGKLCTLHFVTSPSASGSAQLTWRNVAFFDQDGAQVDAYSPTSGTVRFSSPQEARPMLCTVGGYRNADHTALVRIVADGAGMLCGGTFCLRYDVNRCTLIGMEFPAGSAVVTNPETVDSANGEILVTWVQGGPAAQNQPILTLTFSMLSAEPSSLQLEPVSFTGTDGEDLGAVECYGGQVGCLAPVRIAVQPLTGSIVDGVLLSTGEAENTEDTAVQLWVALYYEGKMAASPLSFPVKQVPYGSFVRFFLEIPEYLPAKADELKLFALTPDQRFCPLSSAVKVEAHYKR